MKTDVLSPVTLNADGSVALIATASQLFALDSADGSPLWTFQLPVQARHLTTPVAGRGNGLSYFGVDDTLYVFRDSNVPNITPQNTLRVVEGIKLSQPVIDLDDTLYALQGTELYTVSPDGTGGPTKSVTTPNIAAISPVEPLMDGAGNLFIIDNRNTLFVFNKELELGNGPQVLPFSGLRPGLQAAPNGSLFCNSDTALFRLTPDVASTVTVTSYADATSYRAASSLVLEGAALPAAASVVFESGDTITIKPFFSVPLGTEAVFTTES
jgi:outer membrane protein assembly factor BamB